ncbi:Geranylgeranyl diphosphate synthase [Rhodovastum atsumiense]|uniref:Polyprenyl synthetase family protein n=1 Tax=Rhodovastum atsumiense TaxID=504468 RepID=A0A5M6IX29_9PROT|nr:polyprenyl synthetase family protein [Rhodovastum atsumiense]KAA5612886.1 polyprenyl synthetase family protein [Rhodovastum atsumiense]CAH2601037.1 Geranylgeranyl diphosphate synthase [Rhodovastum atsumiense]
MDATSRIERALAAAVARAEGLGGPPKLAEAMHYSVFPRGARIRPRLCLAVARACGDDEPAITDAAAASIELMHCGSLVHDDLPCFDDADIRRGKPAVHKAFGEQIAVLAGDALIVMAFQVLAWATVSRPERLSHLMLTLGRAVGAPSGIIAGQAWECEPVIDLAEYQQEKTGALFAAATVMGAAAAGMEAEPWRLLGERLGEAYQVADDIRDVASSREDLGKPIGQDAALGRPSAVAQLGMQGALARLKDLAAGAVAAIPDCPGAAELRAHILSESQRLVPPKLAAAAA